MLRKILLVPFGLGLVAGSVFANSVTVSFDSFLDSSSFVLSTGPEDLRFAEIFSPDGTNTSTHIVLDGLYSVSDSDSVYASNYYGVDLDASAETMDTGVVYLSLPSASQPADGVVTSPIIGIVARSGSWANTTVPSSTTVGGVSGASTYDSEAGTISVTASREADQFTAELNYTVIDEDTIEIDPFTVTAPGPITYDFSGLVLARDGLVYAGATESLDSPLPYDSALVEVVLSQITDADLDGIPDIADSEVAAVTLTLVVGEWSDTVLGSLYGSSADWGYSIGLEWVYVSEFPNLYLPAISGGWLIYLRNSPSGGVWFYNPDNGDYLYFPDPEDSDYFIVNASGTSSASL